MIKVLMIEECCDDLQLCDNSNLSYKGEAIPQNIETHDWFHSSPNSVSMSTWTMQACTQGMRGVRSYPPVKTIKHY